jgi:hypothetical protein
MKKYLLAFLILVFGNFMVPLNFSCYAIDEEGCLTCHQYPGLVRLEKSGEFSVLHIDEARYMRSPHGKLGCRKCHVTVVKVPHTGETGVDCTTNCHREDMDKVKNFPLRAFHKNEQFFIVRLDDRTSCRVCHPLYPHSENKLVRGLLNMHTGFMLCEVCHVKRAKFKNIGYDWSDTENADYSGKPFGTYYNPRTQKAHKSEHFISRIAIFVKEDGKKQLVMDSDDVREAKRYLKKEKTLKLHEREDELEHFHRDVAKKDVSVACEECHSAESILDFRRLGFDEKKAKDLVNLNVKGLVSKYETFYFPNLFGQ